MGILWNRKRDQRAEVEFDNDSSIEVMELKRQTHRTAEQANKDIMRLNKLLRANGITLKIHIATGRHRHAR